MFVITAKSNLDEFFSVNKHSESRLLHFEFLYDVDAKNFKKKYSEQGSSRMGNSLENPITVNKNKIYTQFHFMQVYFQGGQTRNQSILSILYIVVSVPSTKRQKRNNNLIFYQHCPSGCTLRHKNKLCATVNKQKANIQLKAVIRCIARMYLRESNNEFAFTAHNIGPH